MEGGEGNETPKQPRAKKAIALSISCPCCFSPLHNLSLDEHLMSCFFSFLNKEEFQTLENPFTSIENNNNDNKCRYILSSPNHSYLFVPKLKRTKKSNNKLLKSFSSFTIQKTDYSKKKLPKITNALNNAFANTLFEKLEINEELETKFSIISPVFRPSLPLFALSSHSLDGKSPFNAYEENEKQTTQISITRSPRKQTLLIDKARVFTKAEHPSPSPRAKENNKFEGVFDKIKDKLKERRGTIDLTPSEAKAINSQYVHLKRASLSSKRKDKQTPFNLPLGSLDNQR